MQKFGKFVSIAVCSALLLALTVFLTRGYDTAKAGYVAVYEVLSMWILCVLLILFGLALVFPRRTRRLGTLAVGTGLALPFAFFAGIRISESAGWISWANQPMQAFGPVFQASEFVYYNLGFTEAQMEGFQRASLYQPAGVGFDLKPGITYCLRLSPSQAHGHDAFAIGISESLPQIRRDQLRSLLARSPLVFRVYHDVAPKNISAP